MVGAEPEPTDRARQRLATFGEGLIDDAEQRVAFGPDLRRGAPGDPDDRRVDVRRRPEHLARDATHPLRVGVEEDADRDGTVRLGSGCSEETVGDLALHHHDELRDRRDPVEDIDHQRDGHAVWEVRDEAPAVPSHDRSECRHVRRVEAFEADVGTLADRFAERGQQRTVQLDGDDVAPGVGQRERQRAEPRTDLEDGVAGADAGIEDDRAREVRIGEEVLTERSGRGDAVPLGEGSEGGAPRRAVTR
jgi:hypothetical protein